MDESPNTLRSRYRYRMQVIDEQTWEILEIPGPGTPVVFLAGGQGTAEVFYKPMLRLAGKIAMYGVHYPPIAEADTLAADFISLLDELELNKVHLVGSSFGAYVAQFVAHRAPERVDQLLLGNTFVDAEEVKSIPVFDKSELASYAPHQFKAERVGALLGQEKCEFRDVMLDQVHARQSAESVLARMMGVAISSPAPAIDLPAERITIIEGKDDNVITPKMKAQVRQRFATADIRVLSEGGHFPNILNADAYTAILAEKLIHLGGEAGHG